jgi:secondary thiamine-phosphate synthase enzyme
MNAGKFSITTTEFMEMIDITDIVIAQLPASGLEYGVCTLFNPHTTAGITINEGADPAVRYDIVNGLQKIVPMSYPFKHLEGNSASHIMASLIGSSLTILIDGGRLILGTWQRIFFCEFDGPRTRTVHWRIAGSS